MGTVTENKKTIKKFKDLNSFVLETMIDKDPEIYSAVAKVLDSIERKYFYSSEIETKEWTLNDFKKTKIIVDTPEKSLRFQGLVLELGAKWGADDMMEEYRREIVNHTDQKYLVINDIGEIYYLEKKHNWASSGKREILYDDIFPEEIETKQWTLDDFKGRKIIVDSPEKSQRFQELLFSLGGKWSEFVFTSEEARTEVKHGEQKYLGVRDSGTLFYFTTEEQYKTYQDRLGEEMKEIFYDDIFPPLTTTTETEDQDKKQKEPVSTTYTTLKDFYKSKIEVNENQSLELQKHLFSLGGMWFTVDRDYKWFNEKYLIIDEKGILRPVFKSAFNEFDYKRIYYSDIFRTDIERAFKDKPLETDFLTWPKPEIATTYRIDKNKGDRKSPTQSAGQLKDLFNDDESKTELFATYFRGNDGNWYRLYEDKNGTWRWSKQATPKQLK